jgi:SAM-dependent methyltransferase
MESATVSKLLDLNRQFYQTFALQFSITRQRLQPGVQRLLESIDREARILDLGCGNGEMARWLARRGQRGPYTGLDFSAGMLAEARKNAPKNLPVAFVQANLASPGWGEGLPISSFDVILAFAVLHHIPSAALRQQVLQRAHAFLAPGGRLFHSEWQFLNSARLRARLQPWEKIDLTSSDVDPGDYLLDWRRGGLGLRYVHLFSADELAELAGSTSFVIVETFQSDGEDGKLGLYQVWMEDSIINQTQAG